MDQHEDWDLAVISEASLAQTPTTHLPNGGTRDGPVNLGSIGWTKYLLLSAAQEPAQIRTVYNFFGTQSKMALQSIINERFTTHTPAVQAIRRIARLVQLAPPSIAICAKPPLTDIYKLLASENHVTLNELASSTVSYVLLASPKFYSDIKDGTTLLRLQELFGSILDELIAKRLDLPGLFTRDGSFERLLQYLEEENKQPDLGDEEN